jgi:hypothetical protein
MGIWGAQSRPRRFGREAATQKREVRRGTVGKRVQRTVRGGGATRSENVIRRARLRQPLLAGELVDGRAERENVRFREVHIHVRVQLCK